MKKFILSGILVLSIQLVFGQMPPGATGGGQGFQMPGAKPQIGYGKIKGEVVDSESKDAVPYATVSLKVQNSEKVVGGSIADEKGKFTIKDLRAGNYTLVVSFIGYDPEVIESIVITDKGNTENVGAIKITESVTELDEVVVQGEKELIEEKVDRIIYNAEKDMTTTGGDASDVLRRVPLLTVDLDGNVSLRGSQNIKVLIDNRPSTITAGSIADALKQIPADQIKSVEVITSPSARYDAEGTGGIINIITKKNNFQGTTLNINSSAGLRSSNLGLRGNMRRGRHGFSIGGFGRVGYNINGEFTNDQYLTDPNSGTQTLTTQHAETESNMMFGRYNLGYDYELNKYNWISASVNLGIFNSGGQQNNLTSQSFQNDQLLRQSVQNVDFVNHSNTIDMSLNYIKTYAKKGKEFSILSQYSINNRTNDFENEEISPNTFRIKNDNLSDNKELTLQVDYVSPITEKQILEFGGKNILRQVNSDYTSYSSNGPDDPYTPVQVGQLTNIFDYSQNISAGYLSFTQNLPKDYSIKAGARYEYTSIEADFLTSEVLDIPSYGALVPSINFSKKLKQGNMVKLAYNRRIQRPSLQFLNPNINATNPKNISQGNPNLSPEYTDNFELSFSTYKRGSSINLSAFVRSTNGSIQRVRNYLNDDVTLTTYENIGEEDAYGLSLFGNIMKGKKFMFNAGVDGYYAVLNNNVDDPLYNASNSGFVVSGRIFGSYNLTEKWALQGFSFIRGRRVQLQGYQSGFYMYSLNLNRKFNDDKGSIGFGAENFLTSSMNMVTDISSPIVDQHNVNTMRNMNFKINFSYRIGKMDFSSNRRRGKSINNDDLKQGENQNQQMMQQQ